MIKTVIIDDEKPVQELLTKLLASFCPDVQPAGTAGSLKEALALIRTTQPDLVLLDINLPDGDGFQLIEQLGMQLPKIIFITAYDEYAIRAFKFSAIDYVLKPIQIDELIAAIEKYRNLHEQEELTRKLKVLIRNMNSDTAEEKKIVLKTQESIHIVKVGEIIRCVADHNYTEFYLSNNRKLLVSRTLKEFDDLLAPYDFFRSHQSHLINVNCIVRFDKADGGELVMSDKSRVPVSKRKREELLNVFNQL